MYDLLFHLESLRIYSVPSSEISHWCTLHKLILIHCLSLPWTLLIWKFMTFGRREMSSIIFSMISYLQFPLSLLFLNIYCCVLYFVDCFLNFLSPLTFIFFFLLSDLFLQLYFQLFHWVYNFCHHLFSVSKDFFWFTECFLPSILFSIHGCTNVS